MKMPEAVELDSMAATSSICSGTWVDKAVAEGSLSSQMQMARLFSLLALPLAAAMMMMNQALAVLADLEDSVISLVVVKDKVDNNRDNKEEEDNNNNSKEKMKKVIWTHYKSVSTLLKITSLTLIKT